MRKSYTAVRQLVTSHMQLAIAAVLSFYALESNAQTYCAPSFTNGCSFGDQIDNFSTTGAQTNITNNGSGCSSGNYSYDSTQIVTTLPSGSFDFTVQAGSSWSQGFAIWIDWNNNGTLTDPGEQVYSTTTWAITPFSGTITVPNAVAYGANLRMRVRCSYNSIPTDPCANQSYGEVEDYNIIVLPPAANDAGVASVDTPLVSTCTLANSLWVTLNNSGTDTLSSATVNWSVNGTAQSPLLWNGTIPPSSNDTVSTFVGNYTFAVGDVIEVYTTNPNGVVDSLPQNDTIIFTVPPLSLNGVYTIDSAGTASNNYLSFTEAINDLNLVGVCGPVTFNVANDTYVNQQILFDDILGASATNTITFQSTSGDTSMCIVEYTSQGGANLTYDGVVRFNAGASNIHFKDIQFYNPSTTTTYATVVSVNGDVSNLSFEGCRFVNDQVSSTSTNSSLVYKSGVKATNVVFEENSFIGGSHGVYWYGSTQNYDEGLELLGNEFTDQYYRGTYIYYNNNLKVVDNEVSSSSAYNFGYGIQTGYITGAINVKNNHIYQRASNWPSYGLYAFNLTGDVNNPADFSGNVISMPNSGNNAIYFSNALFMNVANNSVLFSDASTFAEAVYFFNGAANRFYNNAVSADSNALTMYVSGSAIMSSDNNAFSGDNGFSWNGSHPDLASLTAATEMDSNSIWLTGAMFTDTTTLRTCNDSLNAAGVDNPAYMMDMQGDPAAMGAYDIGADQFETAASFSLDDVGKCPGADAMLEAWYFDTIIWNNADTGNYYQTPNLGPVIVSVSGLCGTVQTSVTVFEAAPVDLPANSTICTGMTATVSADIVNGTYAWSTGDTTQSIDVFAPGTYSVTVTDEFGCVSDDMTTAEFNVPVELNEEEILCDGGSVSVDAGISGGSYAWSNGDDTQVATATSAGPLSVTVTDAGGCVSSSTTDVIAVSTPTADFTSESLRFGVEFTNNSVDGESYLWDFGDGSTSTDENPSHLYDYQNTDTLTYTVTLITTNSCGSDTVSYDVYAGEAVGFEELASGAIYSVYPNPAKSVLNIKVDQANASNFSYELYDVQGKVVAQQNAGEISGLFIEQVDVTNLSTGIYLLKIQVGEDVAVSQVVVK